MNFVVVLHVVFMQLVFNVAFELAVVFVYTLPGFVALLIVLWHVCGCACIDMLWPVLVCIIYALCTNLSLVLHLELHFLFAVMFLCSSSLHTSCVHLSCLCQLLVVFAMLQFVVFGH